MHAFVRCAPVGSGAGGRHYIRPTSEAESVLLALMGGSSLYYNYHGSVRTSPKPNPDAGERCDVRDTCREKVSLNSVSARHAPVRVSPFCGSRS